MYKLCKFYDSMMKRIIIFQIFLFLCVYFLKNKKIIIKNVCVRVKYNKITDIYMLVIG